MWVPRPPPRELGVCIALCAEPSAGEPSRVLGALLHGTGAAECHRCRLPTQCLLSAAPCALAGCDPMACTPAACTHPPAASPGALEPLQRKPSWCLLPGSCFCNPLPAARRTFCNRLLTRAGRDGSWGRLARGCLEPLCFSQTPALQRVLEGGDASSQSEATPQSRGLSWPTASPARPAPPATPQRGPLAPPSPCTAGSGQGTLQRGSWCFSATSLSKAGTGPCCLLFACGQCWGGQ